MKTYAITGRMKKAGPTLTPDGKTLVGGKCGCGTACGNRDDGGGFCRCSHHEGEYQEIAELLGQVRTEHLRRHMDSLLTGPECIELRGFGYSLTEDWGEAEELVQVACFKALRSAATYDPSRSLLAWLKSILRNAFFDRVRNSRLTVSLTHPVGGGLTVGDSFVDSVVSVEVRMEQERGTAALLKAIADLPTALRCIVTLCDLEGMTYEGAATRLRIPLGTVRSRLSRCRLVLREKVGQMD